MSELLASPGGTRAVLERFGIRPRRKYGQNFLIDRSVIEDIIDAAQITKDDSVLEIGPGIGTMTQFLAQAADRVVAVEIDRSLEPVLDYTLEDCGNVTLHWNDILRTDLSALRDEYNGGFPLKCVSNLPYSVTTPVLMQLLHEKGCFHSITVMVQKEVAERMMAGAGDPEYGALSLAVRYYAEPEPVRVVEPACFVPRPGVDSEVLTLRIRETPPVDADEDFLFAIIRAAFNQRRKTLANALSHGLRDSGHTITRGHIQTALRGMGLPEDIRGEKLTLEQFADLSRRLAPPPG